MKARNRQAIYYCGILITILIGGTCECVGLENGQDDEAGQESSKALPSIERANKYIDVIRKAYPSLVDEALALAAKYPVLMEIGTEPNLSEGGVGGTLLWYACNASEWRFRVLMEMYPAISKEMGVLGITDESKESARAVYSTGRGMFLRVLPAKQTKKRGVVYPSTGLHAYDEPPSSSDLRKVKGQWYVYATHHLRSAAPGESKEIVTVLRLKEGVEIEKVSE